MSHDVCVNYNKFVINKFVEMLKEVIFSSHQLIYDNFTQTSCACALPGQISKMWTDFPWGVGKIQHK